MTDTSTLIAELLAFQGSDELGNGDFTLLTKVAAALESQQREIERLRGVLEWINAHWDNQDMSHVNFRIGAVSRAHQITGD